MLIKRFGSAWGGWSIDVSLLRYNSYVISAGLAHDISFDIELMNFDKTLKIIGIDPTDVSQQTVESIPVDCKDRFTFIKKALHPTASQVVIGGEANSILTPRGGRVYDATPLNALLEQYDVSLLKMDIEGSEYPLIDALNSLRVSQMCVEWHHWLPGQNHLKIEDTINSIEKIKSFGYTEVSRTTNCPSRVIQESLFIRSDLFN